MNSSPARILVLQLARFGDILQTWPVLRALRRTHRDAEIHLVIRERFKEAVEGLEGVVVHVFSTAAVLQPVLDNEDEKSALRRLGEFLEPLEKFNFARVINLSFSPASSFLTDILAKPSALVSGYTRHADGFLAIPDDTSAYFYAQVGVGRANRYHLTEILAAVAQVDLNDEDFAPPAGVSSPAERAGVIVHLGASQSEKVYPPELWIEALKELHGLLPETRITLIGSFNERGLANEVMKNVTGGRPSPSFLNRVGETRFFDLHSILAGAELLIGADSSPVHLAMLTATPVLNLSGDCVNFWETGPLSPASRVLYSPRIASIPPGRIAREAAAMVSGDDPASQDRVAPAALNPANPVAVCLTRESRWTPFHLVGKTGVPADDFAWALVQALYTGAAYPKCEERVVRHGFQRLFELAELALFQLKNGWGTARHAEAQAILSSVDEMLVSVENLCPQIGPVVRWFQTQRLRLPPDTPQATLESTRRLFEELLWITAVYHSGDAIPGSVSRALDLCRVCVPMLRDYRFKPVEDRFQGLVSSLQEISRHSPKVGGRPWSEILGRMNQALAIQDFIELADQLEFELAPALDELAREEAVPVP